MDENETISEQPTEIPPAEEPQVPHAEHQPRADGNRFERLKTWYLDRKKWTIPLSVLLPLLILAGVPATRYSLASVVHKRNLEVLVLDATTGTPVSGATVKLGSVTAETSGTGAAVLNNVGLGNQSVTVSKKYYKDRTETVMSPIFKQKTVPRIKMTATGRQVKLSVVNLITKKPLTEVDIKVADISAKTDQSGSATVVLPASDSQESATLSHDGYNDSKVTVKVSANTVQNNTFSLTPAGKVYFLSKLSGKIDVVKTNLDGTGRQTVLGGTGNEEDTNTVLLASRDWKYLALLSKRAGSSPSLYLIDTSDDSLKTIDEGNVNFSLTGWVDDNFVYTVTRSDVQLWQPNRQTLKSYDAAAEKLTTLEQTTASGTDSFSYVTQLIGDVYGYDSRVYYTINWSGGINSSSSVSSKQATFNSIKPDGSSKKAIKSFGLASGTVAIDVSLEQRVQAPDKINLKFSDGTKDNFYVYSAGQVKESSSLNSDNFYSADYPTYLQSPSANNTFWSEARDGKKTLFIGDQDGASGKQIATLSDYNTYGWYTENYLLVSKNASELYIMTKDGSQPAIKISDYHKPAYTFYGYGGGYGGI